LLTTHKKRIDMPHKMYLSPELVLALCVSAILIGPHQATMAQSIAGEKQTTRLANPASKNCVAHGGMLSIRKRADGGEYGICVFEDNRQCEEWAMLRGDCPVGGIKITGYITPAAQYCAITGGIYKIVANGNSDWEQGICSFKNGRTCDVWSYYAGKCSPDTADG
jgi:putative hemolysin